jgi:hypothetical protein
MYRTMKSNTTKRVGAAALVTAGVLGATAAVASATTTNPSSPPGRAPLSASGHPGTAPPGGPSDAREPGGVVTALSADSVTITTPENATATFALTSSTAVDENQLAASLSSLAVGERILIHTSGPSSPAAIAVTIIPPIVLGEVVSMVGDRIVVNDPDGFYRTIEVSPVTTYRIGDADTKLNAVTVGSWLLAEGKVGSDHTTLDAVVVTIASSPAALGPMDGNASTPSQ